MVPIDNAIVYSKPKHQINQYPLSMPRFLWTLCHHAQSPEGIVPDLNVPVVDPRVKAPGCTETHRTSLGCREAPVSLMTEVRPSGDHLLHLVPASKGQVAQVFGHVYQRS